MSWKITTIACLLSAGMTAATPASAQVQTLYRDDAENAAADALPSPTVGSIVSFTESSSTKNPRVRTSGVGTDSGGLTTPASPSSGNNVLIMDRANAGLGRRLFGTFETPATGAGGVVTLDVDIYTAFGQFSFGFGSDEGGLDVITGQKITMGLNLQPDGSIGSYATANIVNGATNTFGTWQHYTLTYELGAASFDLSIDGGTPITVNGPFANGVTSVDSLQRLWVIAGTGTARGYYDNLEVNFTPIPEPTLLTLAGLGLPLTLVRRRR